MGLWEETSPLVLLAWGQGCCPLTQKMQHRAPAWTPPGRHQFLLVLDAGAFTDALGVREICVWADWSFLGGLRRYWKDGSVGFKLRMTLICPRGKPVHFLEMERHGSVHLSPEPRVFRVGSKLCHSSAGKPPVRHRLQA